MNNCIITVAPTGGLTSKAMQPNLPEQPQEIITEVLSCHKAGATLAHLHTRDKQGKHTLDLEAFSDILAGIRSESDMITCVSTTNWKISNSSMENKFRLLALKPDFFSFHVNSFNRGEELFHNDPVAVRELLYEAIRLGVRPEFEMFDLGAIYKAKDLIEEFGLGPGQRFQFIFGVNGGVKEFSPGILNTFIEALGPDHHWGVGAVGRWQLPAHQSTLERGGDIRVGFEDNIYMQKGILAHSNAEFVERIADMAREQNISIASVSEARQKLSCEQEIA